MKKNLIIFLVSLVFGFSVLGLRNYYENRTGELKSYWNVTELKESDSKNFYDRGIAILNGQPYFAGCEKAPVVAFFRPPVYPLFLALSFLIFGISLKAVIVLQIIVASMIAVIISVISEMIINKTVGWISGFLAILYYPMWNDAMIINSELLSMLLGLFAFYFILRYYYSVNTETKYLLLCGIFTGLTSLTRGQFFFYSLLFLMFIFAKANDKKALKYKYVSIWFLFSIIPIIAWSIYAYLSAGIIIFISSQGALSIWWGWSPKIVAEQQYPIWNELWDRNFIQDDMIGQYLPFKSSLWFLQEAYNFIVKYPVDSLKIAYFKFLDSWGFIDLYYVNTLAGKIIKVIKLNWDLFLAVPGWIILHKQNENKVFKNYVLYSCILYTVISIMTAAMVRYRIPYLDPLLIILASVTVYKVYSSFILKKSKA